MNFQDLFENNGEHRISKTSETHHRKQCNCCGGGQCLNLKKGYVIAAPYEPTRISYDKRRTSQVIQYVTFFIPNP